MSEAPTSMEVARERSKQHLLALFHEVRVEDEFDRRLVQLHDAQKVGERGNRYRVRVFPAISKQTPIRGMSPIELSFAVFSPIGDLRSRRDEEEDTRQP